MKPKLPLGWDSALGVEFSKPYMKDLCRFLKTEYDNHTVYPDKKNVFRALKLVDFDQVKVVILGQDPYHGPNQANGLAFAVNEAEQTPPSLRNVFAEVSRDLKIEHAFSNALEGWAKQGVLLLNTVLTVRANEAFSHRNQGWEQFTDQVIKSLNDKKESVVFLLWGNAAKSKANLITAAHHHILTAGHPSPLAVAKFKKCAHFSRVNQLLSSPIDWSNS